MTSLEHYFENLLYDGQDVIGDSNKKSLTRTEQKAVEACAQYVVYTMFEGRDRLQAFLKHGNQEWAKWVRSTQLRCSRCGHKVETEGVPSVCPECHSLMEGYIW